MRSECDMEEESFDTFLEYHVLDGDLEHTDYEHLQQEGGGEGGAEDCFAVWRWKDKIYRLDYSYYSYHGYGNVDMDRIYEVQPREETITVYE